MTERDTNAWIHMYRQAFAKTGQPELIGFIDWFRTVATFSRDYRVGAYPPRIAKMVKRSPPWPKECFSNCQAYVLLVKGIAYVEGLADSGLGVPMLHSWIVYRGEIIDPTWDLLGDDHAKGKRSYFGVRISRQWIRRCVIETNPPLSRPALWYAYKRSEGVEDFSVVRPPIGC